MHARTTGLWWLPPAGSSSGSSSDNTEACVQLELMSQTSVLITPSGGLGTVAFFLQPGATSIMPNHWVVATNTSEQQENYNAWNIEHVGRPPCVHSCLQFGVYQHQSCRAHAAAC